MVPVTFTQVPLGFNLVDGGAGAAVPTTTAVFGVKEGSPAKGLVPPGAGVAFVDDTSVEALPLLEVQALLQARIKGGISAAAPLEVAFWVPEEIDPGGS